MKGSPKKVLNGKFHKKKEQWGNQEQDGRTSSGGTRHRSEDYEDGEDEHRTEKNGRVF